MPERITYSRLNVLQGEAFFEHLGDPSRSLSAPFWLPADYGSIVRQLGGGARPPGYAMPWRQGQRSTFWKAYCENTPIGQISADTALRMMVPLRLVPADRPKLRVSGGNERLFYDVSAFPHGLAVSLTIQTAAGAALSIDEWRDRMRALQVDPCFALEESGGRFEAGLRARDALEALVRWHRDRYYGPVSVVSSSETPFSIATVIQGSGVDPAVPLSALPELQRTLNAIAALPVNWPAAALPPLDEAILPASGVNASAGDAMYAVRRGRVLWRPALFTYSTSAVHRLHALSCLAHNLLSASVQAEMLRLFAVRYAAVTEFERETLPPVLRQRVATLIGRLWRGERTYRSASVRRLLEDKASLGQVNLLLEAERVLPIG